MMKIGWAALPMLLVSSCGEAPMPPAPLAAIEKPVSVPCDSNDQQCITEVAAGAGDWEQALAGNYQAQRNIAFGFSTANHMVRNPVQACAWRIVILASLSPSIDASDTGNYRFDCGKLDLPQLDEAKATATLIGKRVYGRDVVAVAGLNAPR